MAEDLILELNGITKIFPGVKALNNVQFQLRRGEVHALMGENGAGKSTFIKVITGVHAAEEGHMYLNGQEVHFRGPLDAQEAGIAAVYQHPTSYPELSVTEELAFINRLSLSGQSVSDSILIVAGKNWEKYSVSEDHGSIRLQPGIVGARVNRILKPFGRVFPPDPASIGSAMVGGIVSNNSSGMNCGVHANSDKMLLSARIVLVDGTVLDTGDPESRKAFRLSHPEMLRKIEALRDKVLADKPLTERIRKKYSIKNVTGLNIRPLIAYEDPFDIIAHCMVGSEGTLGFISEVNMRTLHDYKYKASAMVYFYTMKESCEAVVALKKLKAGAEDLEMSAEDLCVKSAEMLDYLSLDSVSDPVYLKYEEDVDAGRIPGVQPGDYHNLTAVLTETKAVSHEQLLEKIAAIEGCLSAFKLYIPAEFTEDPAVYGKYWAIRSGIFPSVGGMRPVGTSCLIEDIAFPLEDLPEATVKLQKMLPCLRGQLSFHNQPEFRERCRRGPLRIPDARRGASRG